MKRIFWLWRLSLNSWMAFVRMTNRYIRGLNNIRVFNWRLITTVNGWLTINIIFYRFSIYLVNRSSQTWHSFNRIHNMERSIKYLFDIYSSSTVLFFPLFLFPSFSRRVHVRSKRANIILKRKQIFSRIIYHPRLVFGESRLQAQLANFDSIKWKKKRKKKKTL